MIYKVIVIFIASLALYGCETVKGAGKDVQSGGEVITNTAEEVQTDIQTSD